MFFIKEERNLVYWITTLSAQRLAEAWVPVMAQPNQGSQIHRISMKFDEMRRNRPDQNSKIYEFWNL
jgi:hypothetical protein